MYYYFIFEFSGSMQGGKRRFREELKVFLFFQTDVLKKRNKKVMTLVSLQAFRDHPTILELYLNLLSSICGVISPGIFWCQNLCLYFNMFRFFQTLFKNNNKFRVCCYNSFEHGTINSTFSQKIFSIVRKIIVVFQ